MPRIRTIKPEAPQHRKVGRLSDRQFRIWATCITQADDEGRLVCDPEQVRVWAFAYHPDVTTEIVEDAIQAIAQTGLMKLYEVDFIRYVWFPSWRDHQRISHPTPSKLPAPPEDSGGFQNLPHGDSGGLHKETPHGLDRKGLEGIGSEGGKEASGDFQKIPEKTTKEPSPASSPDGSAGAGELQNTIERVANKMGFNRQKNS